jgi:G:T-mismatch repair DNA endonuclease (very short patch repair protein)
MKPRVYVSLELLNKCLENNKASLIGIIYQDSRNKLTRNATIEYTCNCEKNGKRCFRELIKFGAFCKDCALQNEKELIQKINIEKINKVIEKFKEMNDKELLNKKFIEIINILVEDTLQRVPNGFWDNKEAVDCYIIWFKLNYNIEKDDDWYNIRAEDIVENEASGLLSRYNHSLINLLKAYYPHKEFLPWKFRQVQKNYWKNIDNKKYCLDWLIKKLNYNTYEDYYNLSLNMFCNNECARLVGCYQDSTYELLNDLCPEYKWKAYKFGQVPILHWKNPINRREWCDDYYKEHNFISIDDWYKINQELIKEWYGNGLIQRYKSSPYQMLKDIYPEYSWDKSKFKVCGYSKKSCEFSEKLSKAIGIPIKYARSTDGEYRIPTTRYSADNYIDKYNEFSKIIIEFHGCDVHGCIIEDCKFRRNKSKEINRYGIEFKIAYNKTQNKINRLKELGYITIEIWECQYKNIIDYKEWFDNKLNCIAPN